MMRVFKLSLLFFLFSLYSCQEKMQTTKFIMDSSIDVIKESVKLSSIITVKRIIPLETTDATLIGDLGKIVMFNDKIYVLFKRNTLLVFDDKGKFLRKIGSIGEGPGEYRVIGDFDVTNHAVFLRDYHKILQYDDNGEFMRSIPFDVNLFGINVVEDKILGFVTGEKHISYIYTHEGKCLNKYHLSSKAASVGASNYYWPYGKNRYIFPFVDSNDAFIYDVRNNTYDEVKLVDLPDMLSLDDMNDLYEEKGVSFNARDYGRVVWPLNSNLSQMFFVTLRNDEKGVLWINDFEKEEFKAFDCEYIINDVSFVDVQKFFSCFTRSENSFLSYIMPYDLKDALCSGEKWMLESPFYSQIQEIAGQVSDDDNPIIIEYEFK